MGIERGASQLRIARGAAELARLETAAARESLDISQAQFEAGRVGSAELEKARAELQEKEIAVVESEKVLWQRQIELLRLTNSLSPLLQ
jgi:outer membrane protein TolC